MVSIRALIIGLFAGLIFAIILGNIIGFFLASFTGLYWLWYVGLIGTGVLAFWYWYNKTIEDM